MVLSDEARELRNKKAREYYRTHKQQYREANRRYWERQAAKARAKADNTHHETHTTENNREEP